VLISFARTLQEGAKKRGRKPEAVRILCAHVYEAMDCFKKRMMTYDCYLVIGEGGKAYGGKS